MYPKSKPSLEDPSLEDSDLTSQIIGSAYTVLNTLRPGLDEKLYERALQIELVKQGLEVDSQKAFPVYYGHHHIGTLIPDLVVANRVVVDPKVATDFTDSHLAQMLGYLSITGLRTALLLNFKYSKLGVRRVSL